MQNPPPLPDTARNVRRAVFKRNLGMRLGEVSLDYALIEQSHQLAEDWINQQTGIRIISIETFHSSVMAVTVVWYEG